MRHHFEKTKYVNRALFVLKGITQFKRRKNSRFEYLVKCFVHKIYLFFTLFLDVLPYIHRRAIISLSKNDIYIYTFQYTALF